MRIPEIERSIETILAFYFYESPKLFKATQNLIRRVCVFESLSLIRLLGGSELFS
jgi:hypothetical protein